VATTNTLTAVVSPWHTAIGTSAHKYTSVDKAVKGVTNETWASQKGEARPFAIKGILNRSRRENKEMEVRLSYLPRSSGAVQKPIMRCIRGAGSMPIVTGS
jgi:hypothetical protein